MITECILKETSKAISTSIIFNYCFLSYVSQYTRTNIYEEERDTASFGNIGGLVTVCSYESRKFAIEKKSSAYIR